MTPLETVLENINHSVEKRKNFVNILIQNPVFLPELVLICTKVDDDISYKAAWGLEFICRENILHLTPYIDQFILLLPNVYKHPAVRPMAKICEYLITTYYHSASSEMKNHLTIAQREKITETCFDWLITDQKVAAKAYAITCLYHLGTEFEWVHHELKTILEQNYSSGSAAYRARSRIVLKKLSKNKEST